MNKESAVDSNNFTGREKRMFERHPVNIAAVVKSKTLSGSNHHIRDFCSGGMLLVNDEQATARQEAINDVIQIHCKLPSATAPCLFEARIVRIDEVSTGVAFINPDLNALQGLMDYVKSSNQVFNSQTAGECGGAGEYMQIAQQCCAMTKERLEPIAEKAIEKIIDSLFESSKTTKDITEQNNFFKALDILNNTKPKNRERFVSSANEQLAESSDIIGGSESKNVADISLGELSLVEEETLDNWLADTGTIEAVEREHKEALDALHKRLEVVFGFKVDRTNNPFGPSLFSHAFQSAIQDIGLHHNVNLFSYKVFKKVLTEELSDFYESMNEFLVKNNILPKFKFSMPKKETKNEKPVSSAPDDSLNNEDDIHSDIHEAGNHQGHSAPKNSQASNSPAAQAGAGDNQSAAENNSVSHPAKKGSYALPETEQDIYALVDELHQLRQKIGTSGQQGGASHVRQGQETDTRGVNTYLDEVAESTGLASSEQEMQAEKVLFTQSEVLHALSHVEENITKLDRTEIRKGIAAALMKNPDGTGKEIAGREDRIINVSTSIFDTMLTDLQVPENMRGWLGRLEMPVLKMAIHDDTLYKESDHLVRQVVNKISKLGMLVGEEETEGQSGIRNALDWLINLIHDDFDGTEDVFERVSNQLDVLVQAQDKKYKENVGKVVEYIDAHKHDLVVDEQPEEIEQQSDEEVLEDWNRRVSRLSEDDWILFDVNTDTPIRLRVAWVAEHSGVIVFVNTEGKKDRVLHRENLAHSLSLGNAETIDDANTPTMDRAQYTTLEKLNRDLVYHSTHDPLTGLIDRREFEKELSSAFAESRGAGVKHALCFIDIDQFKVVNTNLGNEAGDELLVQMASWINAYLEEFDEVDFARLGGDEFGILFHECPLEDALAISEELIEKISKHKFEWNEQRISVTVSLGLVQVTEFSESVSSLMLAAESSCDIAKQTGGGRLQLFYAGNAKLSKRKGVMSWVTKIDEILEGDGLQLRCQRIQPIGNDQGVVEHVHYEILLGLKSERDDLPSIQEFIEAAEYSNRIGKIDRWVVKTALHWIAENEQVLDIINAFSINLSGNSLSDETFMDFIIDQIEETGIPAESICFEITETAGVENLSDAAHFINTIKETGCRFSLGDFGSGMSSYAYLRDLPVDYLKIDGMFIKNIHNSESDYAVVKSITEVAHFMGKRVIAEYVENDEIVEVLQAIGVDFAQGYGIEKPHLIGELV